MNYRADRARTTLRKALVGIALVFAMAVPAGAQSQDEERPRFEIDGLLELRGVESDLDFDQGEEIDSSGIGARARIGAEFKPSSKTEIRVEAEARIFEFRDENRDSLETQIGRLTVTHEVSDQVQVRAHLRRYENIAVLESFSADQTSAGARIQWQKGNDRFRLEGEYREREYDTRTPGNGSGYRVAAQYNRRFGSYHWLRFDVRHEDMKSDNAPRRSYERQVVRVKYSLPVHKRVRVRPSLEYRQWDYDARIARGDPDRDLRRDSYVAPAIDVSAGRASRGLYGIASVEYRLKTSNDERFGGDAIRVGVRVGYRF